MTVNFFSTVKFKIKVTGVRNITAVRKLSNMPLAGSIGSDKVNGSDRRVPNYESPEPCTGRDGAEIFDFVPGLSHVTPNLDYLTKSAKCTVYLSGEDETR